MPRKLWLMRTGHTDPFEERRAAWVDTLHRWFDHYLQGVDNGIEAEPAVTVEDEKDVWHDYADWPVPGTSTVNVFLRGVSEAAPGTFAGTAGGSSGARHALVRRQQLGRRERLHQQPGRRADQPARLPLAAAEGRRAAVRHRAARPQGVAQHRAVEPRRAGGRLQRDAVHDGQPQRRGDPRTRRPARAGARRATARRATSATPARRRRERSTRRATARSPSRPRTSRSGA